MFGLSQKEKDFALYKALDDFSPGKLEKAIAGGADVNTSRGRIGTPLFKAIALYEKDSAVKAAEILLRSGASVNAVNGTKQTILHAAIESSYSNTPLIQMIMDAGADLHAVDKNGNTPLFLALYRKAWDLSMLLVEKGGHKIHTNDFDRTLLHRAIENDAPPALVARLFDTGLNVNQTNDQLPAALTVAAAKGNREYIDLLLAQPGILVDIRDKEGRPPLMLAVISGRWQAVESLLKGKATPDLGGDDGSTPLVHAAATGQQEMLDILVKHGASLDLPGGYGRTALTNAAGNGNIRMVMSLLAAAEEQGVALKLAAALLVAAEKGHGRVVELLIKAGAAVNEADSEGRTPLMKAAIGDQVEVLDILIKAGAKPDTADRHGMSSYDHAVSAGRMKAKDFLGRYRSGAVAAETKGIAAPADDYRFVRLNDHSLEVREGEGLTMTFNFWTQQVIFRDTERPAPVVVQNFDAIQRQESITEAFEKLKSLGGNPPEPRAASVQKKPALRG